MPVAIEVAAAPELIAGYGPVKEEGVAKFRARVRELLPKLTVPDTLPVDASASA
jgi:indolepyruvate ferredoxin oxidoreductase